MFQYALGPAGVLDSELILPLLGIYHQSRPHRHAMSTHAHQIM